MIGQLIGIFIIIFLGTLVYLYTTDKKFKKNIHKKIKKWIKEQKKKQKQKADDELLRNALEKQIDERYSWRGMFSSLSLGKLISVFIVILIGAALLPEISKQISSLKNGAISTGYNATYDTAVNSTTQITGMSAAILNLVPAFFALCILGIAIALVFGGTGEKW